MPRLKQQGITLVESLVAIVVMALGVLGILGVQMRTLADTQTSVRRAQAVRLIEDLSERIRANPGGLSQLASYVMDQPAPAAPPTAQDVAALQTLQTPAARMPAPVASWSRATARCGWPRCSRVCRWEMHGCLWWTVKTSPSTGASWAS